MIRGGSWNNNPANLRSANRNNNTPSNRNNNIGFRVLAARRVAGRPRDEQERVQPPRTAAMWAAPGANL